MNEDKRTHAASKKAPRSLEAQRFWGEYITDNGRKGWIVFFRTNLSPSKRKALLIKMEMAGLTDSYREPITQSNSVTGLADIFMTMPENYPEYWDSNSPLTLKKVDVFVRKVIKHENEEREPAKLFATLVEEMGKQQDPDTGLELRPSL